jgi:hypothetical protein
VDKKSLQEQNSMTHKAGVFTLFVVISMITAGVFASNFADAAKPHAVIDWSNGFPSGEHSTMNIHGKKIGYNCDNSLEGKELYGSSVFVPMFDTSEINIVSNKRSSITEGKAIDPCAEPFGQPGNKNDPALYQLPTGEHQVYWRILGIPNNGNGNNGNDGSSEARITFPTLIDQCDFLPVAFEDGTIVQSFDPDAQAALTLVAFGTLERHTDNGDEFFQNTESIYFDADKTGTVTDGDELLYGLPAADLTPLIEFNESEKHEDNTGTTANVFEFGETIYLDQEILGTVDAGDTRIANAASQGLSEDQGGDAISCEDETLVGLGLVNNKGAFKKTEEGLERFGDESVKGKGKSKAVEITDLFIWSGVVCDASLDTSGPDGIPDGQLTLHDFPGLTEDDIESAATTAGVFTEDDTIDDAELQAYLATLDECTEFTDEWVFNVADIVLYGFDYENNGSSLTQIRFYPTATTEFVE